MGTNTPVPTLPYLRGGVLEALGEGEKVRLWEYVGSKGD